MFSIEKYPILVMKGHSNWDIYRNESGTCVAIPNKMGVKNGAQSSFFGKYDWVKRNFLK